MNKKNRILGLLFSVLYLFVTSCSLDGNTGSVSFKFPSEFEAAFELARTGAIQNDDGSEIATPSEYSIKLIHSSGKITSAQAKAGTKKTIDFLQPGSYEVIVTGETNSYMFEGKEKAIVQASNTTSVLVLLNVIKKPTPDPEPIIPTELTTYYVGGNRASDESGTGAQDNPFATVGKVIAEIGTRTEPITININGNVVGDISITKPCNLIITGNGVDSVLQGTGKSSVLYVGPSGANVTLKNVELTGGIGTLDAGGAICNMHGIVNLEDGVKIKGNSATNGAGVYLGYAEAVLSLKDSVIFEPGNDIYMGQIAKINILGNLTSSAVVNISASSESSGSVILTGTPELIAANYNKFNFVSSGASQNFILDSDGKLRYTVAGFLNDKFDNKLSKTEITRVYVATEQDMNDFYSDVGGLASGVTLDIKFAYNVNEVVNLANVLAIKSIYVDCPYVASTSFPGCTNLENITLSANVKNVQMEAFDQCNFTKIKFEDLTTSWTVGTETFTPTEDAVSNANFLKSHTTEKWEKNIVAP